MPGFSDAVRDHLLGPDPSNNNEISDRIFIMTVFSNAAEDAPGSIAFPYQINRIIAVLNEIITGGRDRTKDRPVVIFPYLADGLTFIQGQEPESPGGKALFQYSPAYSCGGPAAQYAETRLYFQDEQMFHHFFEPTVALVNTGVVPWHYSPIPPDNKDPSDPDWLTLQHMKRQDVDDSAKVCLIVTSGIQETIVLASTGIVDASLLAYPSETLIDTTSLAQSLSSESTSTIEPGFTTTALSIAESVSLDSANTLHSSATSMIMASISTPPSSSSMITLPQPVATTRPMPTSTPVLAYTPGKCNIHIWEAASSAVSVITVQFNITDGAGHLLPGHVRS